MVAGLETGTRREDYQVTGELEAGSDFLLTLYCRRRQDQTPAVSGRLLLPEGAGLGHPRRPGRSDGEPGGGHDQAGGGGVC